MGRSQRIKGHNFEREVAKDMRDIFGEAKRGLQSRNSEDKVADVIVPYFHIECKAHKKAPIRPALEQAKEDAKDTDNVPLAVLKSNNEPVIIAMYYEDFLDIIKEWWNNRSFKNDIISNTKELTNES